MGSAFSLSIFKGRNSAPEMKNKKKEKHWAHTAKDFHKRDWLRDWGIEREGIDTGRKGSKEGEGSRNGDLSPWCLSVHPTKK
jgi:hypothetical protein